MLEKYTPILVLLVLALGFAGFSILASELLGRRRPGVSKGTAYECGMAPQGSARIRLSIHFYLVAVLFILFDVESLLLIPWALAARSMAAAGAGAVVFAEIAAFVAVLGLALAFAWRKGALSWDR